MIDFICQSAGPWQGGVSVERFISSAKDDEDAMGQPATVDSSVIHQALHAWQIVPSGDACLIIQFAAQFSLAANRHAAAVARQIEAQRRRGSLVGITDVVPGMVSIGLHYRAERVHCQAAELPYRSLTRQLEALLGSLEIGAGQSTSREITIPVCYGGEHGPDLDEVARACGLTPHEVIELHTRTPTDVLMLGFAPGHAYIGEFDGRLAIARRSTPRTLVAKGSIGVANRQSVIYPADLPGGWNLIGRTPLKVFDLASASPCLLQAGDRVRFVAIDAEQFQALEVRP